MTHDLEILDALASFSAIPYSGVVYRATRCGLDPIAASTKGGRWMRRNEASVLYTALSSDGALAELSFHWGMLNPRPTKPAVVSEMNVGLGSSIQIAKANFMQLGIDESRYGQIDYSRMQDIGAAAAFLGLHGILVPSARWACENLVIFVDNLESDQVLDVVKTEEVDWQSWAAANGFFES